MQDKSVEGLKLLFLALLPGAIAAVSPQPVVKFGATLATMIIMTKASECFEVTAKETYRQLKITPEPRQLPLGY